MVVSKKDRPRCELNIGDIKIKQMRKFNNLGRIIDNGMYETNFRNSNDKKTGGQPSCGSANKR